MLSSGGRGFERQMCKVSLPRLFSMIQAKFNKYLMFAQGTVRALPQGIVPQVGWLDLRLVASALALVLGPLHLLLCRELL